jgi:hypothetical protein
MLSVPLLFDPPPWDEPEAHLDFKEVHGVSSVTWRALGLTVFHTESGYPELKDFAKHTPDLHFHNHFGFSLGQYSEFFVCSPTHYAMAFGNIEVTIGESSPLAIHLFDRYQNKHFHSKWSDIGSIRIFGMAGENIELVLLNSIDRYSDKLGEELELFEIDEVNWPNEVEEDEDQLDSLPQNYPAALPSDIEPLRCYYYAERNREPAAACIQYYRVLEYYAFLSLHTELGKQRRDSSLSDRDFLVSITKLTARNEKDPMLRLIAKVADPVILDLAANAQLIARPDPSQLGEALYKFRNSIIHAKHDFHSELLVDSIISPGKTTSTWKRILRLLAEAAIKRCSSMLRL